MIANEWIVAGAVVLTIGAALAAWRVREFVVVKRSARMESYLRLEKEAGVDRGQRSARHLMLKLGLTEGQVLDASRRSPAIKRLALTASFPNAIFADSAVFEYAPLGAQGRDSL